MEQPSPLQPPVAVEKATLMSQKNIEEYEEHHVHQIYQDIASHFSSTRVKPWPIVEHFLNELPNGSVGVDVGCGNGKYLTVNAKVFIVASDRSSSLVQIASHHQPHAAVIADNLALPHRYSSFDFAISIAVIHHLSTRARRIEALVAMLELLRIDQEKAKSPRNFNGRGRALIQVWALEQKHSRRGWDEGDEQDVIVPWVMKQPAGPDGEREPKVFHRYYHLYRRGELEEDIIQAGGIVESSGYERDNWWAIAHPKP